MTFVSAGLGFADSSTYKNQHTSSQANIQGSSSLGLCTDSLFLVLFYFKKSSQSDGSLSNLLNFFSYLCVTDLGRRNSVHISILSTYKLILFADSSTSTINSVLVPIKNSLLVILIYFMNTPTSSMIIVGSLGIIFFIQDEFHPEVLTSALG